MTNEMRYVWVQMFCAVKGWQYHPGNRDKLTTADAARIADEMLDEYITRRTTWDGWPQHK